MIITTEHPETLKFSQQNFSETISCSKFVPLLLLLLPIIVLVKADLFFSVQKYSRLILKCTKHSTDTLNFSLSFCSFLFIAAFSLCCCDASEISLNTNTISMYCLPDSLPHQLFLFWPQRLCFLWNSLKRFQQPDSDLESVSASHTDGSAFICKLII